MDKVIGASPMKTIGDTVCRVHKTADFTMLSNGFIGSTNISCQAILLLAQAMSLPQSWNFTIKGLEKICAVGKTAVRNMLKELETWGYLVRTKLMPSKETHGRIKYIYDFYEYSAKDTSVPQADVVMETYTAENATLYKVKKDSHFTVISNKLLRSKKLNPKQKGLLLKVLSLPNTWRFSVSGLVKICKEVRSAIKARLAELTELGYLVRTQLKSNESKNHCFEYIYEFFEIALSKEDAEKKSEKTRKNAKKSVKDLFPKKSKKSSKKGTDTSKKQHGDFRSAENPNAEIPQAEKKKAKRVKNMAKTIITQGGDLVNYANIIAVFVDDELDDDENVLGYNLWGLDVTNDNILLGEYLTLDEAVQAKNKIVDWIDNEVYAKVDLSEKAGDVS